MKTNRRMNRLKIVLIFAAITLLTVLGVGYYLSKRIGNASANAIEGVYKATKDWESKGVSPIDSIKQNVKKVIDSSSSKIDNKEIEKDSLVKLKEGN